MNPPRDHPSSRGRRSQSQRVSEAVDDVPRRWRPRAPRTGGPGARRSAEKRLRRKRFGYAEAQICTHSRTQATVTRRNRGRSTKSRRRLTPQRGAHAARTLTPFCPLRPKVQFCSHSATSLFPLSHTCTGEAISGPVGRFLDSGGSCVSKWTTWADDPSQGCGSLTAY